MANNTQEELINTFMKNFRSKAHVNFTRDREVIAYGWKPTAMKTEVKNLVNAEVTKVLNRLKEYNGAYIGMDGKRFDNMVSHSVIDEELKNYE